MKPRNKKTKEPIDLILASASKGRAGVLKQYGIEFQTDVADIDESSFKIEPIEELVSVLALEKAKKVRERYLHKNCLILTVDTLVVIDNEIIGKPSDKEDAVVILKKLAGRTHKVVSGVVLWDLMANKMVSKVATTLVTFKLLTDEVIDSYAATEEPRGKAGAYASQGEGRNLIEKIVGDPTNVIGLPMLCFYELLDDLGYTFLG